MGYVALLDVGKLRKKFPQPGFYLLVFFRKLCDPDIFLTYLLFIIRQIISRMLDNGICLFFWTFSLAPSPIGRDDFTGCLIEFSN